MEVEVFTNDSQFSTKFEPFDHGQIDRFIAYCRAVGARPLIQVPVIRNSRGKKAAPADAAEMVAYCNKVKGYGVRYWCIGNEPDLYDNPRDLPGYGLRDYIADFNAFADAMKAVDPSIKILGPELAWKYPPQTGANDWMTGFLTGCKGRYDIVSFHRYPFHGDTATEYNAVHDAYTFTQVIQALRSSMAKAGSGDLPLAMTEANTTSDDSPEQSFMPASPQTFLAGLWIADQWCTAEGKGLWGVCFWSISEYYTMSFIDALTRKPKPNYWAYKMVSSAGGTALLRADQPKDVSVYARLDETDQSIKVIVLNKTAKAIKANIVFSGFSRSVKDQIQEFPEWSITVLTIPLSGGKGSIQEYTKAMADKGKEPWEGEIN